MRGARGIEFGVDLPAIPAIGLGSPIVSGKQMQSSQGDGWGFPDWTRFVGAWKKSKVDAEKAQETAGALVQQKTGDSGPNGEQETVRVVSTSAQPQEGTKRETQLEKRKREQEQDDHIVKSATDSLSFVFDWLIERVPIPAPSQILGSSGGSKVTIEAKGKDGKVKAEAEARPSNPGSSDKEVGEAAVRYSVAMTSSRSKGNDSPSQQPPSEMKKRMDKEKKGRLKNELATKADLERFYVALSRKMYDEGL